MRRKQPMQPIDIFDGVARFQRNAIIDWLFHEGHIDLNAIACKGFPVEDQMQLAQLLGYSVSGFGDLSYADRAVIEEADLRVQKPMVGIEIGIPQWWLDEQRPDPDSKTEEVTVPLKPFSPPPGQPHIFYTVIYRRENWLCPKGHVLALYRVQDRGDRPRIACKSCGTTYDYPHAERR